MVRSKGKGIEKCSGGNLDGRRTMGQWWREVDTLEEVMVLECVLH